MIGRNIGGFEIIEEIGRGTASVAYRAHQVSLDRIVTLKILSSDQAVGLEEATRFQQEAQAAARLKYNGIVQVYEAGEAEGMYFIATEYIKGYNLTQWLKRDGRISEANVLIIAESVAHALNYAWKNAHLIHRDIRLENVLVDEDGTIKVADLGLARFEPRPAAGQQPALVVSPNYASPEQAARTADLDCRTDMYSLGIMMYHLITGKLPFEGVSPDQVLQHQKQGQIDDPRAVAPGISLAFSLLLRKMLAKDRRHRHKDWDEIIADLALVKAKRKPATPLPIGPKTTLRNFTAKSAASQSTPAAAASTGRTISRRPGTRPVVRKAREDDAEGEEATEPETGQPIRAASRFPVKLVVVCVVLAVIVTAVVIGAAMARSRKDDPRMRKRGKSSKTQTYDFGSGSFAWTNTPSSR